MFCTLDNLKGRRRGVSPRPSLLLLLCLALVLPTAAVATQQAGPATVEVSPKTLRLEVGQKVTLSATVRDAAGNPVEAEVFWFSRARRNVTIDTRTGEVEAMAPGEYEIIAIVPVEGTRLSLRNLEEQIAARIMVTVPRPAATAVHFSHLPRRYYAGTDVDLRVVAIGPDGEERHDIEPGFRSSDEGVARVDGRGVLHLLQPGTVRVSASADGATGEVEIEVVPDPIVSFALSASATAVRTGDVVHLAVQASDASGAAVEAVPVRYAVSGQTDPRIRAAGATAMVDASGRFVAERSGTYRVTAVAGGHIASTYIDVEPRGVAREVEVIGHAPVRDRHTSDLWVWEGPDGRDYAVTGTWGADGHAYFWDVTDPAAIAKISQVHVDARTVNDVKVSQDGTIAVISREGASNRRNGLVIIDVSDPRQPEVLSSFDDNLTGGVHNVFIFDKHVYALSSGRRYDIINIEDPLAPERVSSFELDTPGHGIHDVWVVDGIAYSSNWSDGVVAVDVGGGGMGGSPANPVMLGQAVYPSGFNHAAFPFRSKSTGKLYGIAGDETFPFGLNTAAGGAPTYARGWIHVFDWEDWDNPVEVARYQVPEAGTHNLWVDEANEVLYVAFYNGGLRAVDISGELLGDLYRQGREIANFVPDDPEGYIANAPMVWGPQPYKGNVFLSDWNSGLWVVRITDTPRRDIGEPRD